MVSVQGDVAFITGAASGFGLALAKELVSKGAKVIMIDIVDCESAAAELNAQAGETVAITRKADTTLWEQQYAAYEAGKDLFGRVDYFFANAGIVERPWLPSFDTSTATERPMAKPNLQTLETNLIGQLNTAALALQVFERQTPNRHGFRGKIVMTASVYGLFPSAILPMYATSKAAVVHFTRSAAMMYAGTGITVNALCPDMTATNIIPPDLISRLFTEDDLCTMEHVIEQFMSFLGDNKDTGRVIVVSRKEVWDQPEDSHNYQKIKPNTDLLDSEFTKILGEI